MVLNTLALPLNNVCKNSLRKFCRKTDFRLLPIKSITTCASYCVEQKVDLDDYSINYEKVGSGDSPLLCMNGALGYIESDFGPILKGSLSKKYTLVAWDPPGYGKSRPPDRDFTGLKFYAKDAHIGHKLMKKLGFNKYTILGWSDGGITGIVQASFYPDSVEKLIIWGANAYVDKVDIDLYLKIFGDTTTWSPRMLDPLLKVYGESYTKTMLKDFCDAFVDCYKTKGGDVCKTHLANIASPTLIIHGMKDPIVGMEHPTYLQQHIANSELYLMPEGKHNLHLRYAEEFSTIVDNFMHGVPLQNTSKTKCQSPVQS